MAVRLAESVLASDGAFVRDDAVRRYLAWYRGPPHDDERAFDTGAVFSTVFRAVDAGCAVDDAARDAGRRLQSAGVNAAHRNAVLAASARISDAELVDAAAREAEITHIHALSVGTAVGINVCARALIRGAQWAAALDAARVAVSENVDGAGKIAAIFKAARDGRISEPGTTDGFAPNVLHAALYFLCNSESFSEALHQSIAFAGGLNFCPVCVGSLGGARWGIEEISPADYAHTIPALRTRVLEAAERLGATWKPAEHQ